MKPLIYAIEDDPALQELYIYSLENEYECVCLSDGAALAEALNIRTPDIILLDIMLPGDDGYAILARLKAPENGRTNRIPVIMVSAKGEEISKVKGLNIGADDYISKPFGVLELAARIKANLRKYTPAPQIYTYKDITVNEPKHEITAGSAKLTVTKKEYNLLALLVKNAGNALTRDEVFANVWGTEFIGESRTLDIHIKQLRTKLKQANSEAEIKTIRAVGYILT